MESFSEIEIFRKKGNEAFEKKDYSNAETFYLKALELNKNDVKTLSNLSACYYNLNNQSESIKYAKECIKIDSNWFKGYFRLALSYQALKEDELAFINAIKCFVCDKSTKKNLSDKFQLDNYSLDSMSIVKDQKELDRILAEWTFLNGPFIFVINDCNVCFHDYDFINGKILIVGFKNSKIETSFQDATAINFSKSECIISSLYIDANKGGNAICTTFSKIQIYDCLFSGISKKSGACICLTMSSLKMRNSKIDGCIEAGLIIAGKSSADIKDCEVLKTGQDIGSGIEI
jgi:tetratricopeptide (TPR) repeat protein